MIFGPDFRLEGLIKVSPWILENPGRPRSRAEKNVAIEVTLLGSTSAGLGGRGPNSFGQGAHVSCFRGLFYANVGADPFRGEALETFQVATLDGRNQRSFWMAAQTCVVVLYKLLCVGALVDSVYAPLYLRVHSQHHTMRLLVFF